jgi:predicted PolB exonuclease-like 3'-5' exonuclease
LAYKYDDSKGYFITATKNELLNDFITNRIFDIEAIYDELAEANKIDDSTKKLIQKFLDQIQSDEPYLNEEEDIKYLNYKSYKINKIKILLYNNLDKITKDIALVISNE